MLCYVKLLILRAHCRRDVRYELIGAPLTPVAINWRAVAELIRAQDTSGNKCVN